MQSVAKDSTRIMDTSQPTQPNSGLKAMAKVLGPHRETGVGEFSDDRLNIPGHLLINHPFIFLATFLGGGFHNGNFLKATLEASFK